jgi:magnesium chelatase subunit D
VKPDPHKDSPVVSRVESRVESLAAPNLAQATPPIEATTTLLICAAQLAANGCSIWIKGPATELRTAWLDYLKSCAQQTLILVPAHVDRGALFGGVDLASSLHQGLKVMNLGILHRAMVPSPLKQAKSKLIALQMTERWERSLATELALAIDKAHDSIATTTLPSEEVVPTLIALDESLPNSDESMNTTLSDRLALCINLNGLGYAHWQHFNQTVAQLGTTNIVINAQDFSLKHAKHVQVSDAQTMQLVQTASALGIDSSRLVLNALQVMQTQALINQRTVLTDDDFNAALALSLLPRATRIPQAPANEDNEQIESESPEKNEPPNKDDAANTNQAENSSPLDDQNKPSELNAKEIADLVLEAALATLPTDVLERLTNAGKANKAQAGRSGQILRKAKRGQRIGTTRKPAVAGARPDLLGTIYASLPWQHLRQRTVSQKNAAPAQGENPRKLHVLASDFRYAKYKQTAESLLIFAVDASGSAAMNRLAETKGAIELLLAQSYARRDRVAMIAFRGQDAQIVLEPTRSLTRAKRSLAGLPGGGATPLAAGLDNSHKLALRARQAGQTPYVILLSDGKANITSAGEPGRPQAHSEALAAAKKLASDGIASLFIDTSPLAVQGKNLAQEIATQMSASYLALPYASAKKLAQHIGQKTAALATSSR